MPTEVINVACNAIKAAYDGLYAAIARMAAAASKSRETRNKLVDTEIECEVAQSQLGTLAAETRLESQESATTENIAILEDALKCQKEYRNALRDVQEATRNLQLANDVLSGLSDREETSCDDSSDDSTDSDSEITQARA